MSALDLAETNKIRKALGLPLLGEAAPAEGPTFKEKSTADGSDEEVASTLETRAAEAGSNWNRKEQERQEQLRRNETKEKIRKAREKAERLRVLEGKGLGDADDAEVDTRSWLLGQKKRQKKIEKARAARLAEELAERERQAEYTEKDLAGVHVAHALDDFEGINGEAILTLADKEIGKGDEDDEEDELENAELRAKEKLEKNLEAKKRKRVYNPMDNDGEKSGILSQYDDELDPKKKRKLFTLSGDAVVAKPTLQVGVDQINGKKGMTFSLDSILGDDQPPASDYLEAKEIKVKKPKKKKEKSSRRKALDDEDIVTADSGANGDAMDIDGALSTKKAIDYDVNLDDMDLQSQLAKRRSEALKQKRLQKKKLTPEELARQLREEQPEEQEEEANDEEAGLIIDETTQFVANLRAPTPPPERKARKVSDANGAPPVKIDGDVNMEDRGSEDEDEDEEQDNQAESAAPANTNTTTGLDEEAAINDVGVGAILGMLNQRGLVKTSGAASKNDAFRHNQGFLQAKAGLEAEYERRLREARERERASGRIVSQKQREEENKMMNERMQLEKDRALAKLFAEYKPSVNITYKDEYGRDLGAKEAFRELSHQFHGKGSGKQKTEKKLKKIEDEKKREAMSALDSSQHTGMSSAMGATARKNRQAGVRLE